MFEYMLELKIELPALDEHEKESVARRFQEESTKLKHKLEREFGIAMKMFSNGLSTRRMPANPRD